MIRWSPPPSWWRSSVVAGWLPLPLVLLAVWTIGSFPRLVEHVYSKGLYPLLSGLSRGLLGWIPFSVGDILYTLAFLLVLRALVRFVRKRPRQWIHWRDALQALARGLTWVILSFYLLWGLNYYRVPLEESLDIRIAYSTDELKGFATDLADSTRHYHRQLSISDSSLISIPHSNRELYRMTARGFEELQKEWPGLGRIPRGSIKPSIYSTLLSYMGYSGYLNPFTGEAQVNANSPSFIVPTLSAHEAAHQLGYASEGDTNFIGQLVAIRHPDPYYRYAGYASALRYTLSELYSKDRESFDRLWSALPEGIKEEYRELARYRERYRNPFEKYFESTFDAFLKANRQKEGIASYNRVVGLLIGYDRLRGI